MSAQVIEKIIHDINASRGNRKGCQGLSHSLESDGYIPSIVKWVGVTTPERIDTLVEYISELQDKLKRAELAVVTGLESIDHSLHVLRVETARSQALAIENAELKFTLESVINPDNQPEYHDQGMGCGVEDRGYQRDGYAACYYGWENAMERVYSEVIPSAMPETPATDSYLAEIRAQAHTYGVDGFISFLKQRAREFPQSVVAESLDVIIVNAEQYVYSQQLRKESGQ